MLPRSGENAHRAIVAALLVALVTLAGCGSGASHETAGQALARALRPSQPLHSGNLYESFSLTPSSSSSPRPVALTVAGPFDDPGAGAIPSLDLAVTTTQSGASSTVGMVVTAGHLYLDVAGSAYSAPPAVYAALAQSYTRARHGRRSAPTFNSFGIDPAAWLHDAHDAGTTTLAGARVRHVVAQLNVPRFVADIGRVSSDTDALALGRLTGGQASLSAAQLQAIARSIHGATVDAYIGAGDGVLRRLVITAHVAQQHSGEAELRFVLGYSDVNRPQHIAPPANAKPLAQLASELQQAGLAAPPGASTAAGATTPRPPSAAAATQTTRTTGTSTATTVPPSVANAAPPAYLRCVQRAGQDLLARTRCAPLLQHG